jgi:tRNA pseudouridine13 synthase
LYGRARSMNVPEEEIGISVFWTKDVPGIGGKLKIEPEDFVVEEESIFPPEDPEGPITIAIVKHRNWEMNRLVRRLGSNLRLGRGRIAFAGTKDKRSVSTQLMTFQAPMEAVTALDIPDIEIVRAYRSRSETRLGALIGNDFKILVRETEREEPGARVDMISDRLRQLGGFPNFFGVQRFGVTRPITHLIGKAMVQGDFEKAVMLYLGEETEYEFEECREARRFVSETKDFRKALEIFPQALTFERMILAHLARDSTDFSGAIRTLPRNLVMMFVHAYQSYLFNKILSMRIEAGMPIDLAVEGDVVLPLDKNGLPDHRRYIRASSVNIERVNEQISEGKGFVSGSLFGSNPAIAEGAMGEIERKVVEKESLVSEDFIVTQLMEASSKGMRRELLAPVKNFKSEIRGEGAFFSFGLNKGCYATSLLREYMKSPLINY